MTDEPRSAMPTAPPVDAPPSAPPPATQWGAMPQTQAPPPRRSPRTVISIAIAVVVVVAGLVAFLTARHGGSSSDGAFNTGDCVTLTSSQVRLASCGDTHDGRITAVLHQSYDTCPSGSDEYDVTDNTGNLCIDRSDSRP
jgi:hypothetical protein